MNFSPITLRIKFEMYISDIVIYILLIAIVFIELRYEKKTMGVVLLHNNDHTLDKVLQNITTFLETFEIQFYISILKEKNPESRPRSTGYLFNIGYRQMPRADVYLFIDATECPLSNFYKIHKSTRELTDICKPNTLRVIDDICGVCLYRNYFKRMDGFSNRPNSTFMEFLDTFKNNSKEKAAFGGYMSTYLNTHYDIVDKTPIHPTTTRFTIQYR
jgi:hypothetical protein